MHDLADRGPSHLRVARATSFGHQASRAVNRAERLAHVNRIAFFERLLPVHAIAEALIELHVLGKQLVGVEPHFMETERHRNRLGMGHKAASISAPLERPAKPQCSRSAGGRLRQPSR